MSDPTAPGAIPSVDEVRERFVVIRERLILQLDALDAERRAQLADHPDAPQLEAVAAEQRHGVEEVFTRISRLLLAVAGEQTPGDEGAAHTMREVMEHVRASMQALEGMLHRMEGVRGGG